MRFNLNASIILASASAVLVVVGHRAAQGIERSINERVATVVSASVIAVAGGAAGRSEAAWSAIAAAALVASATPFRLRWEALAGVVAVFVAGALAAHAVTNLRAIRAVGCSRATVNA